MSNDILENKVPSTESLLANAVNRYVELYSAQPKFAVSAPGRVNLIGEHTDYNDGFVFPMALPLVTVLVGDTVSTTDTSSTQCEVTTLVESLSDTATATFPAAATGSDEAAANVPSWAKYVQGVVRCFHAPVPAFRAVIATSVPLGGGLSSSAALEVATYTFLESLTSTAAPSLKDKALACQKAEHEYAGVPCGIMDQFISVMGQQGHALLLDCRAMEGTQVALDDPDVVVLISDSNVHHNLGASEYPLRRRHCEQAAKLLGKPSLRDANIQMLQAHEHELDEVVYKRAHHAITEIERCQTAHEALRCKDYVRFGQLMNDSHNSLRDDYEVSCTELDLLVSLARNQSGVYGSRMTGGGFGGCTVTLVKADAVHATMQAIQAGYNTSDTSDRGSASARTVTFYIATPSRGAAVLDLPPASGAAAAAPSAQH